MSTTTPTDIALSSFEQDEYDTAYKLCLKAYESLMESQSPSIVITDDSDLDDATTTPSRRSNQDWFQFKRFQTWMKAASSCGLVADGFMSIQLPKPTSDYASTSMTNTLALEDAALSMSSSSEESTSVETSDDEESDIDPDELAQRCQQRSRRQTVYLATPQAQPQGAINTPLPAVAPQLPAPMSPTEEDPESFWSRRSFQWEWDVIIPKDDGTTFTFTMILTPPSPSDNTEHTDVWTPLQDGACNLTVPGCFVLNSVARHQECWSCSDLGRMYYDAACEARVGVLGGDLVAMSIDDQRLWGMHGRMWIVEYGTCVCTPWKQWELCGGELPCKREAEDDEADEAVTPVVGPEPGVCIQEDFELEVTPPASPIEAPKSPRWADLDDDDDELPDLNDWT